MTIRTIVLAVVFLVPMSAGAQTDAGCAAVYDSIGTRVGRLHDSGGGDATVLFEHEGRVAKIIFTRNEINDTEKVFFTEANCTGDAFMRTRGQVVTVAQAVGNDVWYPDHGAAELFAQPIESNQDQFGFCDNDGLTEVSQVVPAYTFTLPAFTPPFHLEPEPCFTLPPEVAALGPRSLLAMVMLLAFGAVLFMRHTQSE